MYKTVLVTSALAMGASDARLFKNPRYTGAYDIVTQEVILNVSIGEYPVGKVTIGLFGDVLPKTCKNFYHLCKGDKKNRWKRKMQFKDMPVLKNHKDWTIITGDYISKDGTTNRSIYGGTFEDEGYTIKPRAGIVGMYSEGERHTNGSKFFVMFKNAYGDDWYDMQDRNVNFGEVVGGFDVLKQIQNNAHRVDWYVPHDESGDKDVQ